MNLKEWLFGEGGLIATPSTLDLFLRANNINKPLNDLWVPPLCIPTFNCNQSGGLGNNWYDRDPLTIVQSEFFQNQAPGNGGTISYRVPIGRKFMAQAVHMSLTRVTVAVPAVLAQQFWRVNGTFVLYNELGSANAVGDYRSQSNMGTMMLNAGDILSNYWVDNSTGGTINYMFCFEGIEFDA